MTPSSDEELSAGSKTPVSADDRAKELRAEELRAPLRSPKRDIKTAEDEEQAIPENPGIVLTTTNPV